MCVAVLIVRFFKIGLISQESESKFLLHRPLPVFRVTDFMLSTGDFSFPQMPAE